MGVDWRLYHVTDPQLSGGRDRVAHVVEQAVLGGAGVIQFRDKTATNREFRDGVRACQQAIAAAVERGARSAELFVNDRVAIAAEFGTHLHIGQDDGEVAAARAAIGADRLLGVSVSSREQLDAVISGGLADVVGIGPVWETATKTDAAPALGIEGVRDLLGSLPENLRAVAIGGINPTNAASVIVTGVDGICVVSAIAAAPDPRLAAQELITLWRNP
jgi:thiamine-phosphate diphosphorylase